MTQVYEAKTFSAWHLDDDKFEIMLSDRSAIIKFSFHEFLQLRKNLAKAGIVQMEPWLVKKFSTIQLYSDEEGDTLYIRFLNKDLTLGFNIEEYHAFYEDLMNFNPELMLPGLQKKHELKYFIRGNLLTAELDGTTLTDWTIAKEDKKYYHVHVAYGPGQSPTRKIPKDMVTKK
jgi:hypothetical protein